MRFTLRAQPDQRLDFSPLTPERIVGLDVTAVERLAVNTTRAALCVGDIFRVRAGNAERIAIAGGSERLDYLGHGRLEGSPDRFRLVRLHRPARRLERDQPTGFPSRLGAIAW